ncbi:hypothetical protein QOT17_007691 [Balamuthia mandrillaris]
MQTELLPLHHQQYLQSLHLRYNLKQQEQDEEQQTSNEKRVQGITTSTAFPFTFPASFPAASVISNVKKPQQSSSLRFQQKTASSSPCLPSGVEPSSVPLGSMLSFSSSSSPLQHQQQQQQQPQQQAPPSALSYLQSLPSPLHPQQRREIPSVASSASFTDVEQELDSLFGIHSSASSSKDAWHEHFYPPSASFECVPPPSQPQQHQDHHHHYYEESFQQWRSPASLLLGEEEVSSSSNHSFELVTLSPASSTCGERGDESFALLQQSFSVIHPSSTELSPMMQASSLTTSHFSPSSPSSKKRNRNNDPSSAVSSSPSSTSSSSGYPNFPFHDSTDGIRTRVRVKTEQPPAASMHDKDFEIRRLASELPPPIAPMVVLNVPIVPASPAPSPSPSAPSASSMMQNASSSPPPSSSPASSSPMSKLDVSSLNIGFGLQFMRPAQKPEGGASNEKSSKKKKSKKTTKKTNSKKRSSSSRSSRKQQQEGEEKTSQHLQQQEGDKAHQKAEEKKRRKRTLLLSRKKKRDELKTERVKLQMESVEIPPSATSVVRLDTTTTSSCTSDFGWSCSSFDATSSSSFSNHNLVHAVANSSLGQESSWEATEEEAGLLWMSVHGGSRSSISGGNSSSPDEDDETMRSASSIPSVVFLEETHPSSSEQLHFLPSSSPAFVSVSSEEDQFSASRPFHHQQQLEDYYNYYSNFEQKEEEAAYSSWMVEGSRSGIVPAVFAHPVSSVPEEEAAAASWFHRPDSSPPSSSAPSSASASASMYYEEECFPPLFAEFNSFCEGEECSKSADSDAMLMSGTYYTTNDWLASTY